MARRSDAIRNRLRRQRFLAEVNSRGIRGQRAIQPVINQNTGGSRGRFSNREARQLDQRARLQIFFADLNPVNAGRDSVADDSLTDCKRNGSFSRCEEPEAEPDTVPNARRSVT